MNVVEFMRQGNNEIALFHFYLFLTVRYILSYTRILQAHIEELGRKRGTDSRIKYSKNSCTQAQLDLHLQI